VIRALPERQALLRKTWPAGARSGAADMRVPAKVAG
jgi:hypothetical protein